MSLINIQQLTFAYEGSYDPIFENTSFQIDTNWKLGFIGRNGRGKTTFLKLLLNQYEYSGTISSSVSFDYFPYPVKNSSQITIDVLEEILPDYEYWRLSKECSLLDLSEEVLYRPFETLSHGEQTKVLLAILFLKENNFLLIDEPTNHLDRQARETVSQYLKRKKSFILVSHDRAFLDTCVDHILSINKTDIEVQQGNFSTWQQNKEYSDQFELAENEKLQKDIKRLSEAARRTSNWSDKTEKSKSGPDVPDRGFVGHKAAKLMKRAKSSELRMEKSIESKSQLLKNIESNDALKIKPIPYPQQKLMEANQLSLFYDEKAIFENISFSVLQGQRIAIQGKNGCGKTSLLKIILGEQKDYQGILNIGNGLKISSISQDTSFLKGELDEFARRHDIDLTLFKTILRKLDFSRLQFEKKMEDFSEGQKKKVLIAKSLCEQAHLYVWDEPLNFIDVLSRIQIENLILEYQPTMLLVEHDKKFVDMIATDILYL
ncbi:ribosomal protection-like ABC-F family protein [Clostridium aminobutyricum]|uniref:ABC-F type ribosomal protection protein n=1 Tax=Clostridium aminobutyricum TaxID=33953 RepID=A0A939D8Q5_CLOAM|nr:ABC-F type ribosomal protection protein [Clostridium aminobutyricum]MBN7773479.1 ABC-F type ribosomal protection protein [Clostridium aminobutyricum]